MKILYIGDPNSIHDLKWTSFFSNKDKYLSHFIYESANKPSLSTHEKLEANNIKTPLILSPFSLFHFYHTLISGFKLIRLIKKENYDLIHVLFITPHLYWTLFTKKPFIATCRGSDVLIVLTQLKKSNSLKHRLLFRLCIQQLNNARYITCTSELQIDRLKNFGIDSNKLHLIRTGIPIQDILANDNEINLPDRLDNLKYIFSPRFFNPIYNIVKQIDAFNKLPQNIIDTYTFVFIKGNSINTEYEKKIMNKLSSSKFKYVIFPMLSQQNLWSVMKNAELVIMTPFSDGTPNSALEAMISKTKLIVSDLNYGSPLFENTCLKVNPNSTDDINRQIIEAINTYPKNYLIKAYNVVCAEGNRDIEMSKLESLYLKNES